MALLTAMDERGYLALVVFKTMLMLNSMVFKPTLTYNCPMTLLKWMLLSIILFKRKLHDHVLAVERVDPS
jgi:hypothetical protein